MNELQQYIRQSADALLELTKQLCRIPAPSGFEDERAAFCKAWLEANGAREVYLDEAKNVVCPVGDDGKNDLVVFMAHLDTVFPDRTPMPLREADGKLYCPGVGDDTANVAVLLMAARYLLQSGHAPQRGVIFAANTCEEGLGNLKGCRTLLDRYGNRVRQVVSFDLGLDTVFTSAVGSARYRITLQTGGGHSYLDFGAPNAIARMAQLICQLYAQPMPAGDATYNVGAITGGTSVNTIAQQAQILYEYRAGSAENLDFMEQNLKRITAACGPALQMELLGLRPGMGPCRDSARQARLIEQIEEAVQAVTGTPPRRISGSTDCNIPFSRGIPAACVGLATGHGAHTRDEYIETATLTQGLDVALRLIGPYFGL